MNPPEYVEVDQGLAKQDKAQDPEAIYKKYWKELNQILTSKGQKAYETNGDKVVKIYRNAHAMSPYTSQAISPQRTLFNILWSNVQILGPSLFSRMPKIVIERRFKDMDPVGRLAAQLGERGTSYMLDSQKDRFMCALKGAVQDRLLPGRGQVWLRYEVEMEEQIGPGGQPILDEEGFPVKRPKPLSEKVTIDPLCWIDYVLSLARNPYEVDLNCRRSYMTREQLVERFGDIGKKVELTSSGGSINKSKMDYEEAEFNNQAEVWEIWDNRCKKVVWITEGYKEGPLDMKHDPLKLKEFFPCPTPLLATTTTDSMIPTADYMIYAGLADELDFTCKRISSMTQCIRLVGAAAASLNAHIKNILRLDDGQLQPVEAWQQFAGEKGGLSGAIDWFPFDRAIDAIAALEQRKQTLISDIMEITGIPDIVRGASDPNETLGAQQLKGHWTVVKIAEKQADVQRFCRDIVGKVAEILFEPGLFSDETLALMCGVAQMSQEDQAMFPQALALLRSDRLRTFRVDIETDSTIALDEDQDKAARMEYINAVNQLFSSVQQVSQFRPELMQPMIESALFAVRGFRAGRPVEAAWERAIQIMEDNDKAAAENPQPPPPDYEMQKLQIESQRVQIEQQKAQVDAQAKAQELQIKSEQLQLDGQKMQGDFAIKSQQIQLESQKLMNEAQIAQTEAELKQFQAQFEQFVETQRLELDKFTSVLDEKEKLLEEARLAKDTQLEQIRHYERMSIQGLKPLPTPEVLKAEQEAREEANKPKPRQRRTIKEVRVKRDPVSGELVGMSRDLPDPTDTEGVE